MKKLPQSKEDLNIKYVGRRYNMIFFKQVVLENEMGIYVMPFLFCKKINISHGFKAFGEDLKTTECLTSGASGTSAMIAEVGVRMEEKPGELCPEKRGIHFCAKFSEVLKNRPLKGKNNRKSMMGKFRYFYCETGEVCIGERFPIFRTNSIVTNAIVPLFEVNMKDYAGNIDDIQQIECYVQEQVEKYWIEKRVEQLVRERKVNEEKRRPYKCIPLYTEEQMKMAKIEADDDVIMKYIYRQALNGYVSLYNGEWLVGRGKGGELVKAKENVSFITRLVDLEDKIQYTQNHAIYGKDLKNEIFCKFTYDIVDQKDYAVHVELVKEYVESEVMEDGGKFGGIHFVPLSHIEVCLNSWNTFYRNKIALIEPIEDEIYYEYMENVFVGNKVFVSKVMKLYEVDTWRKLSEMADVVKEKKNEICNYLRELEVEIGHEDYGECIEFVNKL